MIAFSAALLLPVCSNDEHWPTLMLSCCQHFNAAAFKEPNQNRVSGTHQKSASAGRNTRTDPVEKLLDFLCRDPWVWKSTPTLLLPLVLTTGGTVSTNSLPRSPLSQIFVSWFSGETLKLWLNSEFRCLLSGKCSPCWTHLINAPNKNNPKPSRQWFSGSLSLEIRNELLPLDLPPLHIQ